MAIIYGLRAFADDELRYVGFTKRSAAKRLANHLVTAKSGQRTHRDIWIRDLLNRGTRPEIVVLEEVTADNWSERERFWIAEYRSRGANLCNHTDGGDGHYHFDRRTRDLLSATMSGRKQAPRSKEWCDAISVALKGKPKPRHLIELLADSRRGRKWSASDEKKQRCREVQLARWARTPQDQRKQSPGWIAKRTAFMKGRTLGPLPESVKQKLRVAQSRHQQSLRDAKANGPA